jgi:hypothetical protein
MSSNRRIEEQVEGETVDVAAAGVGDSDEAGAAGEAVVGAAGGGDDDKKTVSYQQQQQKQKQKQKFPGGTLISMWLGYDGHRNEGQ